MDYRQERLRLQSYNRWPHSIWNKTLTPLALADAGLYFTGKVDRTKCFECGIELYHWRDGDNPRLMHQRINPHCRFIRNAPCGNVPLGIDPATIPILAKKASSNSGREICTLSKKMNQIPTGNSRNPIQVRIAETAPLARVQFQTITTSAVTSSMIVEEPSSLSEEQHASSPSGNPWNSEKTGSIKETALLCKVCFERDLQVVFLPCGHIVTCKRCASKLRYCCYCRMTVKDRKQIFIP